MCAPEGKNRTTKVGTAAANATGEFFSDWIDSFIESPIGKLGFSDLGERI
jgi:hypothetical protein